MRNLARVLVFDAIAPAVAISALLIIGVMLDWPLWWVSVCSILCLLIVEAVVVNIVGYRRDSVTVGTDDDKPVLRMAVVAIAASAKTVGRCRTGLSKRTPPRSSGRPPRSLRRVRRSTRRIRTRPSTARRR